MSEPAVRPRVRFAPSPTGFLHVGGARTALFNWVYARKHNGVFLLRVEDTDRQRSTDESTRAIFEGLRWLGLDWDEEVIYQGANLQRHQLDAERLVANGSAYRDFTEQAAQERERDVAGVAYKFDRQAAQLSPDMEQEKLAQGIPYAIRFRVPEGATAWDDVVHGTITFDNKEIEDFVILRSDRTPVYNMAVVSDDIDMRITLVMRGDDHIPNTPKQILLYRALGSPLPQFAHVPMIHGADGKKLSKRHGATAVGDYQYKGILPGALRNFLALLGWSPGDNTEVMTPAELLEKFSFHGLQRKAAIFDMQKLEWMNGQYLALISLDELETYITPRLVEAGLCSAAELADRRDWYHGLLDQLRVRARTIDDVVRQAAPYFQDGIDYDPDAVSKQWRDAHASREILSASRERLEELPVWDMHAMEEALHKLAEELGISRGKIFQPVRVALTGQTASPPIFHVLYFSGRERSLARLKAAVDFLRRETGGA